MNYEARRNSFMPAQPLVTFVSPGRALAGGASIWTLHWTGSPTWRQCRVSRHGGPAYAVENSLPSGSCMTHQRPAGPSSTSPMRVAPNFSSRATSSSRPRAHCGRRCASGSCRTSAQEPPGTAASDRGRCRWSRQTDPRGVVSPRSRERFGGRVVNDRLRADVACGQQLRDERAGVLHLILQGRSPEVRKGGRVRAVDDQLPTQWHSASLPGVQRPVQPWKAGPSVSQ
jgi:hypothetical protein